MPIGGGVRVSVLLSKTYGQLADATMIVGDIHTAVEEAVGTGGPIVQELDVVGNAVTVTISDSTNIDAGLVEDAVRSVVGPDVTVIVNSPYPAGLCQASWCGGIPALGGSCLASKCVRSFKLSIRSRRWIGSWN